MKLDALDHPKTLDFAARLEITRPTAIGHLELLWAFTGKYATPGDIGKHADGAIARACDWMGDPSRFVAALIGSGFVDRCKASRLVVHDWQHHAPRWVKSKLHTLNLTFANAVAPDTSRDTSPPSKGSEVKRSEAKGITTAASQPCLTALQAVYPKRAGSQPWTRAAKAIAARLREGVSESDILEGASRYASFAQATGIVGTAYVMQAATFCGPDKPFLESWDPPPTSAEIRQNANVQAGRDWLEADHAPF